MLWLSLLFPQLALEHVPGLIGHPEPWALESAGTIVACNGSAQSLGIHAGQSQAAALALAPGLHFRPHDPAGLAAALHDLAETALGFSSEVSIEPPQSLLLEIGASLRYFGGLQVLLSHVHAALSERGRSHRWAVAPTPLAALWCARHRSGSIVLPDAQLPVVLSDLPISVLELPQPIERALLGVGLEQVGLCLAMPPRALAQRHGPELLALFDRALGRRPDPRVCFRPPDTFSRTVELPMPVRELPLCLPVLSAMLPDLVDWARRHGQLLTQLAIDILHERHPATRVVVGFSGTRQLDHLRLVVETQLQRQAFPYPVAGFRLQVLSSVINDEPEPGLLPAAPLRLREGQELMERLRARLGSQAVQGLVWCHDHRPEHAWRYNEPGGTSSRLLPSVPPRPLWLLESPRSLGSASLPVLHRALQLLSGPERIESGWWDGADIARDYFIAAEPDGPQYWVYRDCRRPQGWFLHGVFA